MGFTVIRNNCDLDRKNRVQPSNMEISSSKIGVAVVDLRTKTDKMQQILFVGM
jgi:hypothetical protein